MTPSCDVRECDALALMRSLPDRSVDCLISDPPYNNTELEWDKAIDWVEFWNEAKRITKPSAIHCLFAQQPFATDLICSNRKSFRYEIVWEKANATGFLGCNKRPMRCHELIMIFCDLGQSTYNPQKTHGEAYEAERTPDLCQIYGGSRTSKTVNTGDRFPRDVLKFSIARFQSLHPTQKPMGLIKWLVATYSNPGDLVLDPFLGSGTTAKACQELGRHFIGCDSNPEYVAIARDRLNLDPELSALKAVVELGFHQLTLTL